MINGSYSEMLVAVEGVNTWEDLETDIWTGFMDGTCTNSFRSESGFLFQYYQFYISP